MNRYYFLKGTKNNLSHPNKVDYILYIYIYFLLSIDNTQINTYMTNT